MDEKEFVEIIEHYVKLKKKLENLRNKLSGLKVEQPVLVAFKELEKLKKERAEVLARQKELRDEIDKTESEIERIENTIIRSIPKNIWVKAGKYYVAWCHDSWGGLHPVVEISTCRPSERLYDRLHYS